MLPITAKATNFSLTILSLFLLTFPSYAQQTQFKWQESFNAPQTDSQGNLLTGSEILHLESFKGSIFAANGYWGEKVLPFQNHRGQVLRLDRADGKWNLDYQFPYRFSRAEGMESVKMTNDFSGKTIPNGPFHLLVVGGHYVKPSGQEGLAMVALRNEQGEWTSTILGRYEGDQPLVTIRAIGQYQDKVTGASMIFAGVQPDPLGVFTGVYDPSVAGKIRWSPTPELRTGVDSERVLGFAECGGKFYVSTSSRIYERQDGVNPTWIQKVDVRRETFGTNFPQRHLASEDMRALTCIPNPKGQGEVLLFGWLTKLLQFDPTTQTVSIEADLLEEVSQLQGKPVGYLQINEYDLIKDKAYIGLELIYQDELDAVSNQPYRGEFSNANYTHEALILVRQQSASGITYSMQKVTDPLAAKPEILIRVRDVVASPFPEEQDRIYAGGFAPRRTRLSPDREYSNTGWIYRTE